MFFLELEPPTNVTQVLPRESPSLVLISGIELLTS